VLQWATLYFSDIAQQMTMRSVAASSDDPAHGGAGAGDAQWPDADTARMVAEERPEQESVIAVPREGGGASTYQMQRPGCAARGLSLARA
jgi:hypothetical protein